MTQYFLIFLGLIMASSCHQRPKVTGDSPVNYKDTIKAVSSSIQSNFDDTLKLPIGFTLDRIIMFDSARNAEIQIVIPRYKGETYFDKQISAYLKQWLSDYRLSLDTLIQNEPSMLQSVPSGFYVEPVSIYKDDKIVSYCFVVSSDHAGAAHPYTEYCSFNFDLKTNRKLKFFDYFNVHSKADTQSLIAIVNNAINRSNVGVENLKDIDFNIEQDCIAFNFDDYEIASYAEGIIKARVAKENLKQFVTSKFR